MPPETDASDERKHKDGCDEGTGHKPGCGEGPGDDRGCDEGGHGQGDHAGKGHSNAGGCDGDRRRRRGRKRDASGRFADSITGEDVLGVFDAVAGPVVTSTDVSDMLGVSTESARQHLNKLVADGSLRRRKTGRTVVYWAADTADDD